MIAIGVHYNSLESCSIEGISKVLEVLGGISLFNAFLWLFGCQIILLGLHYCEPEFPWSLFFPLPQFVIGLIIQLVQFGVQIWASVVVYGKSLI